MRPYIQPTNFPFFSLLFYYNFINYIGNIFCEIRTLLASRVEFATNAIAIEHRKMSSRRILGKTGFT